MTRSGTQLAGLKRGDTVPVPTNLMEREKLENNAESAHKAAEMMKFSATSVPADVCHGVASSVANLPTQNASGNCLQIELGYPCTFLSHLHRLTVPCHSR